MLVRGIGEKTGSDVSHRVRSAELTRQAEQQVPHSAFDRNAFGEPYVAIDWHLAADTSEEIASRYTSERFSATVHTVM